MPTNAWEDFVGRKCGADNRLQIRRKVGEGGFGAVFEAVDTVQGGSYAIKFLHDSSLNDPDLLTRFQKEGTVWKGIRHPNLVRVMGLGQQFNMPFILSEFVDGVDLEHVLRTEKKLEPSEALRICRETASALAEVHRHSIIHRDLKPTNLLLQGPGRVAKLLDFGLAKYLGSDAKITKTGQLLGSPGYMSPEQIIGKDIDLRSDIFSLGILVFEMLTGKNAIAGKSTIELLRNTVQGKKRPTEGVLEAGGKPLLKFVDRMLEVNPKHRFQNMFEVVVAIDALLNGEPANATTGLRALFGFLKRPRSD